MMAAVRRWASLFMVLPIAVCWGCAQHVAAAQLPGVISTRVLDSGVHVAGLAAGPRGAVWLATLNYGNGPSGIIQLESNGQMHRYQRSESLNRVAVDANGTAWFTVGAGASGQQPKLVRVDDAGRMHDYPLPEEGNFEGIAIGADGVPWFVDAAGGEIGRVTPAGNITYYGPASGDPTEIVNAGNGSLWFTEASSNKVGRVNPDGSITEFRVPTPSSRPAGIAVAPDGNVWFCESAANKIARIKPQGRVSEFPVPTSSAWPLGIAVTPSGQIWFTELTGGKIGRLTGSGRFSEFAPPGGGYPGPIVRLPDGSLWVATNAKRDAVLGLTTTRSRLIHFRP